MPSFRKGQWVTTSTKILGAHETPDGRAIGVYQPARTAMQGQGSGSDVKMVKVSVPEGVFILAPDGHDLYAMVDREAKPVMFSPAELKDLRPLREADHLPEKRRSHLSPGLKLAE